jgi:hypothetical protein
MAPVLAPVQVVGDVEVLVPVLQGVVLVMTLRPRHRAHPFWTALADEPNVHRAMEPDKRTRVDWMRDCALNLAA